MKVLQVGYGKMGKLICRVLKNREEVTKLVVSDLIFENSFYENGIEYIHNLESIDLGSFDCAFVSTPATTHGLVLKELIKGRIKNIFVEKPAVINEKEFNEINEIRSNCKIVTGYILRQSETAKSTKKYIKKLMEDGYKLELCSVIYQKYMPSSLETRGKYDMGVYDEMVHIWDLLFNYLEFDKANTKLIYKKEECDAERKDRVVYSELLYRLEFCKSTVLVNLKSSFIASKRCRNFDFELKNNIGEKRHIFLSFDNDDNLDKLIVSDSVGNIIYQEAYPSKQKLNHQTEIVFNYFKTGDRANLSLFEDAKIIVDMLGNVGVN